MSERPDLRDLVGDDATPEELRELERVDALLRAVPAPPPSVPESLTQAVTERVARQRRLVAPRVLAAAASLALVLAALAFGIGRWTADDGFAERATVRLAATENARGAEGLIRLSERQPDGNWSLELEVRGLAPLEPGGYYVLWLAKDGEYAGTCGTFAVGPGTTTVSMNASYRLAEYDAWVVTAHEPGAPEDEDPPWLLEAPIRS